MATQDPIQVTESAWVLLSEVACAVQVLEGVIWLRHSPELPSFPVTRMSGKEYDGHMVGANFSNTNVWNYTGTAKTYCRAMTKDGAVVVVTEGGSTNTGGSASTVSVTI